MKKIIILIQLVSSIILNAQDTMTFVHPGGVNGQTELEFVKEKIAAGEQPWLKAFNDMKSKATGGSSPLEWIDSHDDAGDANTSKQDALKAYANALTWYYTDDEKYAEQAIAILNDWTILQGFNDGTDQDKLHAGWIGALFGPAAEIMRDYSGWQVEDIAKVQEMFKRAYYPQLLEASTWNGNVDLTQIDALLNIAVFNEDSAAFFEGIERLRKRNPAYFYMDSDPAASRNYGGSSFPGSWSNPTSTPDGLTQETCRDNNHHAQFAMASAIHAAEVAWNQGVDLYGENTERYTAVMELMANQFITDEMLGTCSNNQTTDGLFNTWEMGYYHYHHRMGLTLPKTERLLKQEVRVRGWSALNIFYETLTHGDPTVKDAIIISNKESNQKNANIYPNPSNSGIFNIENKVKWSVFRIDGKKIKTGCCCTIDLSDQKNGLYIIKHNNDFTKVIID